MGCLNEGGGRREGEVVSFGCYFSTFPTQNFFFTTPSCGVNVSYHPMQYIFCLVWKLSSTVLYYGSDFQVRGLRFELSAAYLKLLTSLHLDHKVQTRLLMRGEFVLPRSQCTKSTPLFLPPNADPHSSTNDRQDKGGASNDPHPGCQVLAASIKHNISSSFCQSSNSENLDFSIIELKELVLKSLEKLLHSDYYKMHLLPSDARSPIFVPMIKAMDHLLVLGVLNEERDLQRLLHLLDPNTFVLPNSKS